MSCTDSFTLLHFTYFDVSSEGAQHLEVKSLNLLTNFSCMLPCKRLITLQVQRSLAPREQRSRDCLASQSTLHDAVHDDFFPCPGLITPCCALSNLCNPAPIHNHRNRIRACEHELKIENWSLRNWEENMRVQKGPSWNVPCPHTCPTKNLTN